MSNDSGSEKTSTPPVVVAHRKRFLWPAGGLVALIVLNGVVIWWARYKESPAMSDWLWPLDLALFGLIAAIILWKVPQWQVKRVESLEPKERFGLENETRKTLATILGGVFLLGGIYFSLRNLRVAQEGQITDRFTKAIDQLGAVNTDGKPKLEVRLGGIYALERIANESEKDHWPIMEVLCTYVRENAPRIEKEPAESTNEEPAQTEVSSRPTADIQAIVTVLGRRNHEHEHENQRLDLSNVELHGAYLDWANLGRAGLYRANLSNAHLTRADLRQVKNLTQEQIYNSDGDSTTKLPGDLSKPESWKK